MTRDVNITAIGVWDTVGELQVLLHVLFHALLIVPRISRYTNYAVVAETRCPNDIALIQVL